MHAPESYSSVVLCLSVRTKSDLGFPDTVPTCEYYVYYVWDLTKRRHSIFVELFAYRGLALYILVTALGYTSQVFTNFAV